MTWHLVAYRSKIRLIGDSTRILHYIVYLSTVVGVIQYLVGFIPPKANADAPACGYRWVSQCALLRSRSPNGLSHVFLLCLISVRGPVMCVGFTDQALSFRIF